MQITEIKIRKLLDSGRLRAVVSVTFDGVFAVHDIKVVQGERRLFVAMPSRKMGEGDFRDIAHPLVSEMRERIKTAIFAEYDKILAESENTAE